jgi:hypothetical protein
MTLFSVFLKIYDLILLYIYQAYVHSLKQSKGIKSERLLFCWEPRVVAAHAQGGQGSKG